MKQVCKFAGFCRRNYLKFAFIILCLIAISSGLVTVLSRAPELLHSDSMWIISFFNDLFVDPFPVAAWTFPDQSAFFPDLVLYLLLTLVAGVERAFMLYPAAILITLSILGGELGFAAFGDRKSSYLTSLLAVSLWVIALSTNGWIRLAEFSLFPTVHTGVEINGLLLLISVIHGCRRGFTRLRWVMITLLLFLGAFSDLFLIPQFVFPILATLLLLWKRKAISLRPILLIALLAMAALVLSRYAQEKATAYFGTVIRIESIGPNLSAALWMKSASQMLRDFFQFGHGIMPSAILALFALVMAAFGIGIGNAEGRTTPQVAISPNRVHPFSGLFFLSAFSVNCFIFTVIAPIHFYIWQDFHHIRYVLPVFIAIPLVMAQAISGEARKRFGLEKLVSFLALSAAIIFDFCALRESPPSDFKIDLPYPADVQCLDELAEREGLRYGFGDYWSAKYFSILSKKGLHINSLYSNLSGRDWMANITWLVKKTANNTVYEYPKYTFIFTNNLDLTLIRKSFGNPAREVQCAQWSIFIYNRADDNRFISHIRKVMDPFKPRLNAFGLRISEGYGLER